MASVSVIIPCWRCASTIGRALSSVAAQTLKPLEVILIDDASEDETLATLRSLASAPFPCPIKLIALKENRGPGPARNAGWDAAVGDYVALLDADDGWHSRKLELQMAWMALHPGVTLSGHSSVVLKEGDQEPAIAAGLKDRRVSLFDILYSNPILTRTVVMQRAVPLRFGDGTVLEDLLLWLEMAGAGYHCRVLDAPLAFSYRPEFSPGGYSGALWKSEIRELRAIRTARHKRILFAAGWCLASVWSLLKFGRRLCVSVLRRSQ